MQKIGADAFVINGQGEISMAGAFGLVFTISGATNITLPQSGTIYSSAPASISSAQLLSSMSDETGTGLLVFNTSPNLTTPNITSPTLTLGSDATGDIYYNGGAGVLTRLAVGAVGTVLIGGITPSYSNAVPLNGAAFATTSPLMIHPSANLRDGGWNTALEIQANAINSFPAIIFGNQTGSTRFGSIFWTRSTTGNTATTRQVSINGYELGTIGVLDFNTNGNIGTTSTSTMIKIYGSVGVFIGAAITPTAKLHIASGTSAIGTAPLKLTSSAGVVLGTPETGAIEYNGTNLFFTRTGTTRETINCSVSGAAAPATNAIGIIVDYYGTSATRVLTTPDSWESVNIAGVTYKRALYL